MNAPESYYSYHERDDEIDLRDIALAIYNGWKWIVSSIIVCLILGFIYTSVLSAPQYLTEIAYSTEPGGLRVLNSMPGTSYTEIQAFEEFSRKISSYENFRVFYEKNLNLFSPIMDDDPENRSQLRYFFFEKLDLTPPQRQNEESQPSRILSLRYKNEIDGPKILNDYFSWTETEYIESLIERANRAVDSEISRNSEKMSAHIKSYKDDVAAKIKRLQEDDEIKIAQLEDRLAAEKQSIIYTREERIRILEHAESIASRLGIEKPTTPRDFGRQTQDRDVIYAEINSQGSLPLYFMGLEALKAEREVIEQRLREDSKTKEIRNIESQLQQLKNNRIIEAIQNRENATPYIEEYSKLRAKNEILSASMVSPDEIDVASVTRWAYQPNTPDSPRTGLIMVISVLLGGFLGIIILFIANFVRSIKSYKNNS